MDEMIAKIKEYLKIINYRIDVIDQTNVGLLDYVIGETLDRVLLYLGSDKLPAKLERVLANIVNTNLTRCLNSLEHSKEGGAEIEHAVSSISDNGQSISYANELTRYFSTTSDEDLFSGFTSLLSRYRRVKVVYPKDNENGNS